MVAKWLQAAGNLNQQIPKGGFFNYVDKILAFFDRLPPTSSHLSNKSLILENSTPHKTKMHPVRLLISLQNFQHTYRT